MKGPWSWNRRGIPKIEISQVRRRTLSGLNSHVKSVEEGKSSGRIRKNVSHADFKGGG